MSTSSLFFFAVLIYSPRTRRYFHRYDILSGCLRHLSIRKLLLETIITSDIIFNNSTTRIKVDRRPIISKVLQYTRLRDVAFHNFKSLSSREDFEVNSRACKIDFRNKIGELYISIYKNERKKMYPHTEVKPILFLCTEEN